jgi:membrane protease YdiL (CAAX protease family)
VPTSTTDTTTNRPTDAHERRRELVRSLAVAAFTTALVTVISYRVPDRWAATAVGMGFLAVTFALLRREDADGLRAHGLSLGGVLDPEPIDRRRVLRETGQALSWAVAAFAMIVPPFWIGFRVWYAPTSGIDPIGLLPSIDLVLGQLLVIALPEEAFFRGYLQSRLDRALPPTWSVAGARIGPSLFLTSAIFAIGHLLTLPNPARLAVFFPSLLFGWLRARTGGIGAGFVFHALCNLLSAALQRAYGLGTDG